MVSPWDFPATARQKLLITRLCVALGIKEPIEEEPMTMGIAGKLIRKLQAQVRSERKSRVR